MKNIALITLLGLLFFSLGCEEKGLDPDNVEKSYLIAKEPYDDETYEIAISKLNEFKTRFPYSQYATEAELLIANSYFELGQFIEAASAYETFVKLHPKHPKVDFAMYRVGESNWQEAPEEIDREQDFTILALDDWNKLLTKAPDSQYAKVAKEKIAEGNLRLAKNHQFIARFYCKLEIYHACAQRYLKLAESYPQYKDFKKEAYEKAAEAFEELSRRKAKDPDSDKNVYFKTYSAAQLMEKSKEYSQKAGAVEK